MINLQKLETSPKALDAQSIVSIDEWVVLDSPKHKETDPEYEFSKMVLISFRNGFSQIDSLGRIWVRGINEEEHLPYHYECGNKLYGLRIATAAAN